MGRVMEPPPTSATVSSAHRRIGPAGPPAEDAAIAPGPEWREAAKAVAVIVGTEVLLAVALAMGLSALGR